MRILSQKIFVKHNNIDFRRIYFYDDKSFCWSFAEDNSIVRDEQLIKELNEEYSKCLLLKNEQ